jgi:hypothetical protein
MEYDSITQYARSLLADFARREGAWRTLATNLIPLVGFILFGWSFLLALVMVYVEAVVLVFALTAVLAVHVIQEEHPRPWTLSSLPKLVAKGFVVWLFGGLIANAFAIGGFFILLQMLGAPWAAVTTEVASDGYFLYGVVGLMLMHGIGVIERLQREDAESVRNEAVGDFRIVLLRAFFFPLFGGLLIQVFALLGRFGAALVLLILALAITAGDVYRREWLQLFEEGASPDAVALEPASPQPMQPEQDESQPERR